jgi:lipid-A-disaccharide synthase
LLVVAGEGSGDMMAAAAVARLRPTAFGIGGSALRAAGVETLVDVSELGTMGLGAVLANLPQIGRAAWRVLAHARTRPTRAALLVGYTEFNAWLGPRLRQHGISVLWYGAPQIWAWRWRRGRRLARACDRMAVLLPFEEPWWRSLGVAARYVGHPALEQPSLPRAAARARLGAAPATELVALLPGSRNQEVRHHLGPMLVAVTQLRARRPGLEARLLLASSVSAPVAARTRRRARAAGVPTLAARSTELLSAFDVALAASGTATLQCAAAAVPVVIAYRTGPLTALAARQLVQVSSIGLPNLVLGRHVFPELIQEQMTPRALQNHAARLLDNRSRYLGHCQQVLERLRIPGRPSPSVQVAEMIRPWLS